MKSLYISVMFVLCSVAAIASDATAANTNDCRVLYDEAAAAIHENRANCGVDPKTDGLVCRILGSVKFDVLGISTDLAGGVRLLENLHLLPNQFARAKRLFTQADTGGGLLFNRTYKKFAKLHKDVSEDCFAKLVSTAATSGVACRNNNLMSVREIAADISAAIVLTPALSQTCAMAM